MTVWIIIVVHDQFNSWYQTKDKILSSLQSLQKKNDQHDTQVLPRCVYTPQ